MVHRYLAAGDQQCGYENKKYGSVKFFSGRKDFLAHRIYGDMHEVNLVNHTVVLSSGVPGILE